MVFPRSLDQDFLEKLMGRISILEKEFHRLEAIERIAGSEVIDQTTNNVQVVNTAVETEVLSFQLDADKIGTTGVLIVRLSGRTKNITVGSGTLTFRGKLGGTTFCTLAPIITSGRDNEMHLEFSIYADQSAVLQEALMWARDGAVFYGIDDTEAGAEDTTTDLAVSITVEWVAADPNAEFNKRRSLAVLYV